MQLIFGSSSGIGLALAQELAATGETLELFSHKPETLHSHFSDEKTKITAFDGYNPESVNNTLKRTFDPKRNIESVYIVFGTGHLNPTLTPTLELETVQLNALAFTAVASHAYRHFLNQGHGKLIGISSVAAVRGSSHAPAYNASKAFVASYLEGLRGRASKECPKLQITEIRPGFVDTAMMKAEKPFWLTSPQTAVKSLLSAVQRGKAIAYVPRRWQLIAILLKILPASIYHKL